MGRYLDGEGGLRATLDLEINGWVCARLWFGAPFVARRPRESSLRPR